MAFNPFQFVQFLQRARLQPLDTAPTINAFSKGLYDVLMKRKEDIQNAQALDAMRVSDEIRLAGEQAKGDIGVFGRSVMGLSPELAMRALAMQESMTPKEVKTNPFMGFDEKILQSLAGINDEATWEKARQEIAQKLNKWVPEYSVARPMLDAMLSAKKEPVKMSSDEYKQLIDQAYSRLAADDTQKLYTEFYSGLPDELKAKIPEPGSKNIEKQFAALRANVEPVIGLQATKAEKESSLLKNKDIIRLYQNTIGGLYVTPPPELQEQANSIERGYKNDVEVLTGQITQGRQLKSILDGTKNGDVIGSDFIATIYSFMKLLDPRSVVRGEEFRAVYDIEGFKGALMNLGAKATGDGYILTKKAADKIRETIDRLLDNAKTQIKEKQLQYGTRMLRLGVLPTSITDDADTQAIILRKALADYKNQEEIFGRGK